MQERIKIDYIDIDKLVSNEKNPNRQSDAVFNSLVENIQEIGMVEPIMVAPLEDKEGYYQIVSGHHRVEACKMIGYDEVPSVIQYDFDEDLANMQLVRMNVLKGQLDPIKFTELYEEMADKYGEDLTRHSMGLMDDKMFQALLVEVKEDLPEEIKAGLDEAEEDIKTVDDLSRILNGLFNKYGDTLDYHFMVFTYGGKNQLWVMMEKETNNLIMNKLVPELSNEKIDINDYFNVLLNEYGLDEEVLSKAKELSKERGNTEIEF